MSFIYIENDEDLTFLSEELMEKRVLGIDTEFRRTTKDNMKLALLQINDGEEIYLIDILRINDFSILDDLITSKSNLKIFHSCKEDLEAIYSWSGQILQSIYDTQLAEAFLGNEFSISYQSLVSKELGVELVKEETRSNWMRRPLRDSQMDYAASDVEFLINLYDCQINILTKTNKLEWLKEELDFMKVRLFKDYQPFLDPERRLPRHKENDLLAEFNELVLEISEEYEINPTLFFSKKNQKIFLRNYINNGQDDALSMISGWRRDLIKPRLINLI